MGQDPLYFGFGPQIETLQLASSMGKNLSSSENNDPIWQIQAHVKQNPWHLNVKILLPILNEGEIGRATCTLCTPARATPELGVTSLKNNTIKPCKGKPTSLRRSYTMHYENGLLPGLIPPLTMRKIVVFDEYQGLPPANPSHMKKSIIVNADAKAPFIEDWEMMR